MNKRQISRSAALLALCLSAFAAGAAEVANGGTAAAGASASAAAGNSVETLAGNQLAAQFETFAGSAQNAQNLVNGLRSGAPLTLTGSSAAGVAAADSVTIVPPTGALGFGEIKRALSLAQAQLAAQGVTAPTPRQIQAALMGGVSTNAGATATTPGVLQLRSQGMGWGEIAQALNVSASGNARLQGSAALSGTRQRSATELDAAAVGGGASGAAIGSGVGMGHGFGAGGIVGGAAGTGGLGIGAGARIGGGLGR